MCERAASRWSLALLLVATSLASVPASAQDPDATLPPLEQPSPFLPGDHWAATATRRLHAAGLVPPSFEAAALRTPRLVEVAGAFAWAVRNAPDAGMRSHAGRWLALLQREFGTTTFTDAAVASAYTGSAFAHGAGTLGGELVEGRAGTGIGYLDEELIPWSGTTPLDDEQHPLLGIVAYGAAGSRLGFGVDAEMHGVDEPRVRSAHAILDLGPIGLWAGHRAIAFGPGHSGTIVLGDGHALTGAGLYLADGVRLPWILRYLGPVRFEGVVSRVDNGAGDGVTDPFFGVARLSSNIHPRFALGATRATMFGGDNALPFTWKRFGQMLIGDPSSDGTGAAWSNEVFAWDFRFRPPLGSLPLSIYAEHGMDDASGAYWRTPAIVAGLEIGMMPGLPELGAGLEFVHFSAASGKNTIWYRNYALTGGWTHDRRPLGHPLGGHGQGWYGHASLDLRDATLRLNGAAFLWDRGDENLFAPERVGRAFGGTLRTDWRATPNVDVSAGATFEDGADWYEATAELRVRYLFGTR